MGRPQRNSFPLIGCVSKHRQLYEEREKKGESNMGGDGGNSQDHPWGGSQFPTMTPPPLPSTTIFTRQTGRALRCRAVGKPLKSGVFIKSDRVNQLVISKSGGSQLDWHPDMVCCR